MYCIILSNTITKNPKKTAEVNIEIVERDLKGDGYIWFFFVLETGFVCILCVIIYWFEHLCFL